MWWINANQNRKGVSSKLYYAAGFGGNYIVVDNEHDLVIVARWMDSSKMGSLVELIIKSIESK